MWGDVILICGLFSSLLFGYLNPLKLKSKILILIIGWMIFMVIEIGLEVNESEHGKREAADFIKKKCDDLVSFTRYLVVPCEEAKRLSEMSVFVAVFGKLQNSVYVIYFETSAWLKNAIMYTVAGSLLKWISPPLIHAWNHYVQPPGDLIIKE